MRYTFLKKEKMYDLENIMTKKEMEELRFLINMNKEYHHHLDHPIKQVED
jgi:hypothetical protein